MSFLDNTEFPWNDDDAAELHELLVRFYRNLPDIQSLVELTPIDWASIDTLNVGSIRALWMKVLDYAARTRQLRTLVEAAEQDPTNAANFQRFLTLGSSQDASEGQEMLQAMRSLAAAGRSRAPVIIGVEADEPLVGYGLTATTCHLTIKLSGAQVLALETVGATALATAASVSDLVNAGRQVWRELTAAEPRLDALQDKLELAGAGATQPIAWCGSAALLERIGPALQIVHRDSDDPGGFVTVVTQGHYLMPLQRPGTPPRTMHIRADARAQVTMATVDLREPGHSDVRADLAGIRCDAAIVVSPPTDGVLTHLATVMREGSQQTPTRAVLGFGSRLAADEVEAVLADVPFVSYADSSLAVGPVVDALSTVTVRHGEQIAMPCIVAAVRAAWVARAIEDDDVLACRAGLSWGLWSWAGLPLFSRAFDDVERPLYPHLTDLRSVASPDWYVDRRAKISREYQAGALAAARNQGWFHLYLSGAGGTGKSCFLRHVHDEITTDNRLAVWYRVDAPSSQWDAVERRLREETVKAVERLVDPATAEAVAKIEGPLGKFLREAVIMLREKDTRLDEITVFIDQLERTFESGDQEEPGRLETISRELLDLLKAIGVDNGIRVVIASRKQYLPDFLVSSRAATSRGLEFNVLQALTDGDERTDFVRTIESWCRRQQLIASNVGLRYDAVKELVDNIDRNPLNMMLALIQLFSQSYSGIITKDEVQRQAPWSQLFRMDLADAERDDLDLVFLLAMAHARSEIVRFEDVMWRVRMVDNRLTRRVDELSDDGVRERLWLLGILGRTIYARPDPITQKPMRFVEFFHANLRDYLLREVMAPNWSRDSAGHYRGTPPSWRALDRLAEIAHDWDQTLQPLRADEIRVLIAHRDNVVAENLLPEQGIGRFGLLFLRDPMDTRDRLGAAASECFAYSALINDVRGRWALETLYPDVAARLAVCRSWLERPGAEPLPILRHLVSSNEPAARALIVELLFDRQGVVRDEFAQAVVSVLLEPRFAARWRTDLLNDVLVTALQRVGGDPARLDESVSTFVVAACGSDRDTLVGEIAKCVTLMASSDEARTQDWGRALDAFDGLDRWIGVESRAPLLTDVALGRDSGTASPALALSLGDDVRAAVDDASLQLWSAHLAQQLGVPIPPIVQGTGLVEPDEAELQIFGERVARGVFRPGWLRAPLRRWEQAGGTVPNNPTKTVEDDEDYVWLPPETVEAAAVRVPVVDFTHALLPWLERSCRRSFARLYHGALELHCRRLAYATPRGVELLRDPRLLRFTLVALVEEGVPIPSLRALLSDLAELTDLADLRVANDPALLLERVRESSGADICRSVRGDSDQLAVILLERRFEESLADLVNGQVLAWTPVEMRGLADAILEVVTRVGEDGRVHAPLALVTVPRLRRPLVSMLRQFGRELPVLSFTELDRDLPTPIAGVVAGTRQPALAEESA